VLGWMYWGRASKLSGLGGFLIIVQACAKKKKKKTLKKRGDGKWQTFTTWFLLGRSRGGDTPEAEEGWDGRGSRESDIVMRG